MKLYVERSQSSLNKNKFGLLKQSLIVNSLLVDIGVKKPS